MKNKIKQPTDEGYYGKEEIPYGIKFPEKMVSGTETSTIAQWEHKKQTAVRGGYKESELDEFGKQGWELTAVVLAYSTDLYNYYHYYFKRPKKQADKP